MKRLGATRRVGIIYFDAEAERFEADKSGGFLLDSPEFGKIHVLPVESESTVPGATVYRSFEILMMEAISPQDRLPVHRLKKFFNGVLCWVDDTPQNQSESILGGHDGTDPEV